MVDYINYERNKVSDLKHIKVLKDNKFFNIFSNKVWRHFLFFFKFIRLSLIFLTTINFFSAILEGLKAASIVLLITFAFANETRLADLQNNFFISKFLILNNYFELETRYFIISLLFISLIILTLISVIIKIYISWHNEKLTNQLLRIVRKHVLEKLFSFNIRYYTQAKSGELIFLTASETNRFGALIWLFMSCVSLAVQFVIFYVILMYMFWNFTLLLTLMGLIYYILHLRLDKKLKILSWSSNLLMNTLSQFIHQTIYGIKLIKIAGLENRQSAEYLAKHQEFEKLKVEAAIYGGISKGLQEVMLFISLTFILVLIIQIYDLDFIKNHSESFLAYVFLMLRSLPVIISLQNVRSNLINAYGPLARVMNLLFESNSKYTNSSIDNKKQISFTENIRSIKLENLRFSYEKKEILNIDNFEFKKNKLIAIVGSSGSGKSTLLDILSNLIDPLEGKILINGINLKNIKTETYQKKLGYMNQEPIIFHDTVRNNISFFDKSAQEDKLVNSLKLSCSYEFVFNLDDKLDHSIGERGQTISGGQKQRLGLTRIFLQNPEIILLDEATNALDFKTEKIIYDNIKKISKNKLIIIAAHRLSALIEFDEIIVLGNGMVKEVGNHNELMQKKGIYYDMFNAQLKNL